MTITDEAVSVDREQVITDWYLTVFPSVAAYVRRKGGTLEETKEVFQEAILTYYEKRWSTDLEIQKTDQAYLFGIAKIKWLQYRANREQHEDLHGLQIASEASTAPASHKLLQCLQLTGRKCMDMLQAFYYEKLSMEQLAHRFGYSSERSATVQKYKCLEKVRDEVKSKSMTYEDFFE